jgi:hypothetical protein
VTGKEVRFIAWLGVISIPFVLRVTCISFCVQAMEETMDSNKVRDYLGIIGNAGLILGLLLVGFQIKQTNDLAKAQFLSDAIEQAIIVDLGLIGEMGPEVLARVNSPPSDLSDGEILVLERLFRIKLSEQLRLDRFRKLGLSDTSVEFSAGEFGFEMDSTFGRMYWDVSKEHLSLSPDFINSVDAYLSEAEESKVDFYRRELKRRASIADDA